MKKVLLLFALFAIKPLLAHELAPIGPTIECRFAALTEEGHVALDEVVGYTLIPGTGVSGIFEPYSFDISVLHHLLTVGVYVGGDPVSGIQIPVINIINLPLGASVFGLNTVYHEAADGFVSVQYECKKVQW